MPKALIEALQKQGVTSVIDLAHRLQVSEEALRIRMGLARDAYETTPGEDEVEVRPLRRT